MEVRRKQVYGTMKMCLVPQISFSDCASSVVAKVAVSIYLFLGWAGYVDRMGRNEMHTVLWQGNLLEAAT
jgi:hypothetical protein